MLFFPQKCIFRTGQGNLNNAHPVLTSLTPTTYYAVETSTPMNFPHLVSFGEAGIGIFSTHYKCPTDQAGGGLDLHH